MPEDIVSALSINSFKGRFDKHYAHLRYCTEYGFLREKIGLQVYRALASTCTMSS